MILNNLCAKLETDRLRRGAPWATEIYLPPPLVCKIRPELSDDVHHKIWEILTSDVTMTSYKCFHQQKDLKGRKRHYDVTMTSNFPHQISAQYLQVSIPNFCSISLKVTELLKNFTFLLSQILQGTFCNFVAMVTPRNVTNWYDL